MNNTIKLSAVAAAVCAIGASSPAIAWEPVEFGDGYELDTRLTTTYTLGVRMKSQDKSLAANAGGNDGNNNFDRGSLTANRLALLFDGHLRKGSSGLVLSASTFYDDVYHRRNDNAGPVNKPDPVDRFTSQARRYHGGDTSLLDAYVYTSFDVGQEGRMSVRLGRHAVAWGEALFFPGISLAQGPADGTKAGTPGTEVKDILLPEDQISLQYEVNPRWSLLAHAQFNFQETIAPAPGSFLSASDGVGPGGRCLGPFVSLPTVPVLFDGFSGCSFGVRGKDITPSKTGQWGVGARFRVTDETEFGLYYLNYHDRTPLPEINAFTPGTPTPAFFGIPGNQIGNGSYRVRYFDNVKLIGATFSTSVGLASIAGELSHKQGAPVLVNTVVNPATGATLPTPTRADITQANLNAFINYGRTFIAPQTLLIGEISSVHISGVKSRKAPGVEALGPAADFFPASKDMSFSNHGLAVSGTLSLTYPGVADGWDLAVPISYQHQLRGRTLSGGVGGQGDRRYRIGVTGTYRGNLQIGLNYGGYLGKAKLAPLKEQRLLTDRDELSLVVKYTF